jgi:chromosome segregation ATPase
MPNGKRALFFKEIAEQLLTTETSINVNTLADRLQTEIKRLETEIIQKRTEIGAIEQLQQESQRLVEEKEKIIQEYEDLQRIKNDIENLKSKQTALSLVENNIPTLEKQLSAIQSENDAIIGEFLQSAEKINSILSKPQNDLEQQLNNACETAKNNLAKIKDDQINDCMVELSHLKTAFTGINDKINRRIDEHNLCVKTINSVREEFVRISNHIKEVAESYRTHIKADRQICEALTAEGEFKGDNYVKTFFTEIDNQLKTLEDKIKNVVDARAKLPVYELEKRKENL